MKHTIVNLVDYYKIHNIENAAIVGEIEIDEYFEERWAADTKVKHNGKCKICVYDNEGIIPHFHIENNERKFSCCIEINRPVYFIHGVHDSTLSNSDIKKLIKVLSSYMEDFPNITVYEFICGSWNLHNKNKIKKPFKMPDYTKLNDNK